jgi:uncharacterized membrane protein YsdA (DUF1294 family)
MNEGAGMTDGADVSEAADMDAQGAAAIIQEARERAQHEFGISHPVVYATWGLLYLIAYGAIWLSVRGQHPYQAPTTPAIVTVYLAVAVAVVVMLVVMNRAVAGVGGRSAQQRRIAYLTLIIGWLGVLLMEAALRHAGASEGVIGVFGATGPILLAGLVVAASSAVRLDWTPFGLGIWLIAVAALSGFAGPAAVWAIGGLATGLPLLLVAAIAAIAERRSRA